METLEQIVNTIRIAPQGIIPPLVGLALVTGKIVDRAFNLGLHDNIPILESIEAGLLPACVILGIAYIPQNVRKYRHLRTIIKTHGIVEGHVRFYLRWYCDRQPYKAAAYACGVGEEFDRVNRAYTGRRNYMWIPEI